MCDATKINKARAIISLAEAAEAGGRDIPDAASTHWDNAVRHLQDDRAHLALVEANKLAECLKLA